MYFISASSVITKKKKKNIKSIYAYTKTGKLMKIINLVKLSKYKIVGKNEKWICDAS
jgi:hypothetical protein